MWVQLFRNTKGHLQFMHKSVPTPSLTYLLLAGLLAAAAVVRLANLGAPSFWVDELNHVYAGQALMDGKPATLPSGAPNERALLYSRAVALSFKLFGVSEFSARLPSAVFGLLAIVAIFFIARALFHDRVALLAAFFLAFSHNAIGWSRTSRMYTLFQLLFLVAVMLFYRGFESVAAGEGQASGRGRIAGKIRHYLARQGVHPGWLMASLPFFYLSFQVHQLTGLFLPAFLTYVAVLFAAAWLASGVREALRSKYGLTLITTLVMLLLGVAGFGLLEFLKYAVHFKPLWAKYELVSDSHYYYWFLTASSQFPIAALFLIGAVQTLTRTNKAGLFALSIFAVPAFMLSFVFAYRVHNYIFNIYPFYVMIAAYGLSNIWESELQQAAAKLRRFRFRPSPRLLQALVLVVVLGWLPATVWFRYALKLPQKVTGMNGAVDFLDWKGGADYVRNHWQEGDVVISSLPLTVQYYLGRADYNLNSANLDTSLDWQAMNGGEGARDYYTGAADVTSVEALRAVQRKHPRGWIVVDSYRMQRARYIPQEVAAFVAQNFELVWQDARKTVNVFRWQSVNEPKTRTPAAEKPGAG